MHVIVGIPVHNDIQSFKETVKSILNSTEHPYEIFIVESESNDGCTEYCDYLVMRYPHIKVLHTKKEGPTKAYNHIFKYAKDQKKDLLLCQTDVIFQKLYLGDWLSALADSAHRHDSVTIPVNGGGYSGEDYLIDFLWFGGWCTFIPANIVQKINGFDENYPQGYGVDIDLSYQITQMGHKIQQLNFVVYHHENNAREHDNDPDTEKHKQECARYFRKKHKLGEFK